MKALRLACVTTGALFLMAIEGPALAAITLAADDAPTNPPWKQPATLSYVRNGDGTTNATADAVLRYKVTDTPPAESTAKTTTYSFGTYIHRDNDSTAPKNDRGLSASYGQFIVEDYNNAQGPRSFNWNAKLTFGKALQEYVDDNKATVRSDKTKDRQLVQVSGYYQMPTSGVPVAPGSKDRPAAVIFFDGNLGAYSDHSSGGSGKGTGRLTGTLLSASANIAPFGIDPSSEFNRYGGLGFVPTFRAAAQFEKDAAASGLRTKDTYKLYTLEMSLAFSKVSGNDIVPTLNLSRSVGADLLTGRARTSKTELSLGLTF
jgi:hypothetical protein